MEKTQCLRHCHKCIDANSHCIQAEFNTNRIGTRDLSILNHPLCHLSYRALKYLFCGPFYLQDMNNGLYESDPWASTGEGTFATCLVYNFFFFFFFNGLFSFCKGVCPMPSLIWKLDYSHDMSKVAFMTINYLTELLFSNIFINFILELYFIMPIRKI